MPITAKQFELGIDSETEGWMRKIHQFLAARKQEAFTSLELAQELDGFSEWYKKNVEKLQLEPHCRYTDHAFDAALKKLVEAVAVDARTIRSKTYYALGPNPLPF